MNSITRALVLTLGLPALATALPAAVMSPAAQGPAEVAEERTLNKSPISRGEYTDCRPTTTPLVFDGGYRVSLCYETAQGLIGEARGGIWASGQSGLLWFFDRNNAEVLVKVLNGCSYNGRRWIFVAPVTDVAFNLYVTSAGGREWTHRNRLGETAATESDTSAFDCDVDDAVSAFDIGLQAESAAEATVDRSPIAVGEHTDCRPTTTPLVFDGAYQVSLCYETAAGVVGEARGGIWASNQSGLLWFFSRDNAEVLVKVLDGCSHNGHRWIFVAPVTDVAFNLHVRSVGGREWTHRNRLGETAVTASDTSAFDCAADDGVLQTVSVAAASAEEGDALAFAVTQSGPADSDSVLGWSTSAGTATSGADFRAVAAGTLTIAAGETTATLTVSTVEDELAEPNETFTVTLTGTTLSPGVSLGGATATGTIRDDDMYTVSIGPASAEEGTALEFPVTQSGPASSPTVLGWSTSAGTATSPDDFTAVAAGTLTIPAGATTGTLTVSTVEDSLSEADESFSVEITASTLPAHVTLGTAIASGTIYDDDGEPIPVQVPDANLRSVLEAALDLPSGSVITQAALKRLTFLDAGNRGITDLTGLQHATNLTTLALYANRIANLSPLESLTKLFDLRLDYNRIKDVAPLAGLANLRVLTLRSNQIADATALGELTNLWSLNLSFTEVANISPLAPLTELTILHVNGTGVADVSPLKALGNLSTLDLSNNRITDISGLQNLVNLEKLWLSANYGISDASPLRGLTSLTILDLAYAGIADLSPLEQLTNLQELRLWKNEVIDVSSLANLEQLTELHLGGNRVEDATPLRNLTALEVLDLAANGISDISVVEGLAHLRTLDLSFNDVAELAVLLELADLTELDLRGNPLDGPTADAHVASLEGRGVRVDHDTFRKAEFDIELVFLGSFSRGQKAQIEWASRRLMSVISDDLPAAELLQSHSSSCGEQSYAISSRESIDDLRVYVSSFEAQPGGAVGLAAPHLYRTGGLPFVGCIELDLKRGNIPLLATHEMVHVLGFGPAWGDLRKASNGDTHFTGPLAVSAFDNAGGRAYDGPKVPVAPDGTHWRLPVLRGELMGPFGGAAMSAITVQSLADLGYGVDVTQADAYTLPGPAKATGASRKGGGLLDGRWVGVEGAADEAGRSRSSLGDAGWMSGLAVDAPEEGTPLCGVPLHRKSQFRVNATG